MHSTNVIVVNTTKDERDSMIIGLSMCLYFKLLNIMLEVFF